MPSSTTARPSLLVPLIVAVFVYIQANITGVCTEEMGGSPKGQHLVCKSYSCEYTLVIHHARTMTFQGYDIELNAAGELIYTDERQLPFLVPLDDRRAITVDGNQREIIAVNGQFPSPAIEVTKGARVAIRVINRMPHDAVTIHWHGQIQRGTLWSDGTPYIAQCPIQPGQSFTYRFIANPAGTFFYHSHLQSQRVDGLGGVLIVNDPEVEAYERPIPVLLSDWIIQESHVAHPIRPFDNTYTGSDIPAPVSVLFNGRGRSSGHEKLPLEIFNLDPTEDSVFRLINGGVLFAYEISVDDHEIVIEAVHGSPVKVPAADAFIINPGDRIDFRVICSRPSGRFWMRAHTFTRNSPRRSALAGLAVVAYDTGHKDPTTSRKPCTAQSPCRVFNCPYPSIVNRKCLSIHEAQHRYPDLRAVGLTDGTFTELFVNAAGGVDRTLNARKFVSPKAPYYQPEDFNAVDCAKACPPSTRDICSCTTRIQLKYKAHYQLVVSNLQPSNGSVFRPHTVVHPLHLHGHHFAVIKVGYGKFDPVWGNMLGETADLTCTDPPLCSQVLWAKGKPDVRSFNLKNPPVVDTIGIPSGGYVVLRFRADNPGVWPFHCHLLTDQVKGMELLFEEARERIPEPPAGFPECRSFEWSDSSFKKWWAQGRTLKLFPN